MRNYTILRNNANSMLQDDFDTTLYFGSEIQPANVSFSAIR